MKVVFTLVAVAAVVTAIADDCKGACCTTDKFMMQAMHMAANSTSIKGDRWAMGCTAHCEGSKSAHAKKDGKHAKKSSKKSKSKRSRH